MQITIARTELAAAWAWAVKGLPKHAVLPVLHGVKLTVNGDTLTLETFDFERGQRTRVNGTDADPGVILVPGAELKKVISALPKKKIPVYLVAHETTLTVEAGGVSFVLKALPLEEYPALPEVTELAGTLFAKDFARSATRVARVAGTDDTLPVLTGVNFKPTDGTLNLAATDRYRLVVEEVPWTRGDSQFTDIVVPAKALTEFAAKAGTSDKVQVFVTGQGGRYPTQVRFADDTRELIISGIPGEFIRYEGRIPTSTPVNVLVDAPALAAAVKQLTPLVGKNETVALECDAEEIKLSAISGGQPVASLTVPGTVDVYPTEVRFNPGFLASLLLGFDGPVWLGINGNKPALLRADEDAFRAILVPIRNANA
jgi:DNA polymerase-3 subunit beta